MGRKKSNEKRKGKKAKVILTFLTVSYLHNVLHTGQDLVEDLQPQILGLQLLVTEAFGLFGGEHVERDEDNGCGKAREGRYAQVAPQDVDADDDLEWGGPDHVEEGRHVLEHLGVD